MNDPIVDEIRKIRDIHAARFNYDLDAIYRDIKEQENKSGRTYVYFPPRKVEQAQPLHSAGSSHSTSQTPDPSASIPKAMS
jgi:hypothetical protein